MIRTHAEALLDGDIDESLVDIIGTLPVSAKCNRDDL